VARDVEINVVAHDRTAVATASAGKNFDRLRKKVNDVDKDGSKMGRALSVGFGKSLTSLPSQLGAAVASAGIAGVVAAAAIAPLIGATLVAGILLGLGGGFLVAGIIGAMRDPGVKSAASELGTTIKSTFSKATESFIGPVKQSMGLISGFLKNNAGEIKGLFDTIAPAVVPLTRAFLGLAKNALPGIKTALQAAMPFILQIAEKAPALGTAIGKFFTTIAANGPTASKLFGQILDALIVIIPVIAKIIGWITTFYSTMLSVWSAVIGVVRAGVTGVIASYVSFRESLSSIWASIRATISGAMAAIRGVISAGVASAIAVFLRIRQIVSVVSSAFSAARSAAASRIGALISLVASIPGRVRGAVGSLGGILVGAGRSLVQGLINGINAMLGRVRAAASSVRNAVSGLAGLLPFGGGDGGFQFNFGASPAFAASGGGTRRTEAPRQPLTVDNRVYLGNELLDARVKTIVRDELDTRAHRASVGRR
jgi:hypothetical protein